MFKKTALLLTLCAFAAQAMSMNFIVENKTKRNLMVRLKVVANNIKGAFTIENLESGTKQTVNIKDMKFKVRDAQGKKTKETSYPLQNVNEIKDVILRRVRTKNPGEKATLSVVHSTWYNSDEKKNKNFPVSFDKTARTVIITEENGNLVISCNQPSKL